MKSRFRERFKGAVKTMIYKQRFLIAKGHFKKLTAPDVDRLLDNVCWKSISNIIKGK